MLLSHTMEDIRFTATLTHEKRGESFPLEVLLPVALCWEHEDDPSQDDETTPPRGVPHVHSTNSWHRELAVCLGGVT